MSRVRVALVTHDFSTGGGTASLTRFLYGVFSRTADFEPRIISLATSSRDRASVLLTKPNTWRRPPAVLDLEFGGIPYTHVGASFPEFEFQRYRTRRPLYDLLAGFEILQFVTGIPSWACAAGNRLGESLIWFATTVRNDRANRIEAAEGIRALNYRFMTEVTASRERKALKEARAIIGISHYTVGLVAGMTPAERLRMIPCGVDTDAFQPVYARGRGEAGYIMCVGRHSDPRKNVQLLLTAFGMAVMRNPRVPDLYLVGYPPVDAVRAQIEQSPIASRVHITGLRSDEELARLYRGATMLVLPSDEEGLGIVILEAMASGIPVVSTRCGGPETAVVDGVTGYLTPKGNAEALCDAILRIAGDSQLRDHLGEEGLKRAREMFSTEVVGAQFLNLYRGIAGRC